jgi:hypothetical protein
MSHPHCHADENVDMLAATWHRFLLFCALLRSVFTNMSQALSVGLIGVNWSIGLCHIFEPGFGRSHLWAGQGTTT